MRAMLVPVFVIVIVSAGAVEAGAQTCLAPTAPTILQWLMSYMSGENNAVAYAWAGAHWDKATGKWKDRKNPTDIIAYSTTINTAAVSGPWDASSDYSHPTVYDTSHGYASANCTTANCATAELATEACVTNKVDSSGAGAYARTGKNLNPNQLRAGALTGIGSIYIGNRMTLTSGTGDVTGVWAVVVGLQDHRLKPLEGNAPLSDVTPWMAQELGLDAKSQGTNKGSANPQRQPLLAFGFELDAAAEAVKLIGPEGIAWQTAKAMARPEATMTFPEAVASLNALAQRLETDDPTKELSPEITALQSSYARAVEVVLGELRDRFKIMTCKDKDGGANPKCHVASYDLGIPSAKKITIPILVPDLRRNERRVNLELGVVVEAGQAGREESLSFASR